MKQFLTIFKGFDCNFWALAIKKWRIWFQIRTQRHRNDLHRDFLLNLMFYFILKTPIGSFLIHLYSDDAANIFCIWTFEKCVDEKCNVYYCSNNLTLVSIPPRMYRLKWDQKIVWTTKNMFKEILSIWS